MSLSKYSVEISYGLDRREAEVFVGQALNANEGLSLRHTLGLHSLQDNSPKLVARRNRGRAFEDFNKFLAEESWSTRFFLSSM
jgi:hypothetical protein